MASNPTLYDVARKAGVSLATASRALNGSTRVVHPEYRDRVLTAAATLGYVPNLAAQAVARGASSTVALLVSDIADPYFSAIAAGVMRRSALEGLVVTMAVTDGDAAREIALVRMLRAQRPRAIVLASGRITDVSLRTELVTELERYAAVGGAVALVSQNSLPFGTVSLDNVGGARALATALLGLGYRGFAVLAGPTDLVTARYRVAAFVAELPMPPIVIIHGAFSRDAGYAAMIELMNRGLDGIDLVFAANDVMAIGAMTALRERGIDVPGRIAVAGFDDVATAVDVSPALTTVRIPLEEAGASAVAVALGTDSGVELAATVMLRASTPAREDADHGTR